MKFSMFKVMFPHPRLVSFLLPLSSKKDPSLKIYMVVIFFLPFCYCVGLQKHPGSLLEGFTKTQVSTLAVREKFLVAGGFQGELICKVIS